MKVFNCFTCFRAKPKMMKFPTREEFIASYLRQRFSLPDSMIYYITKNPKSSKCYQKIIQACKHFFLKNPILVFHCLQINDDGWKVCSNEECRYQVLTHKTNIIAEKLVGCKIWIQNRIHFHSTTSSNIASDLIPKIYQCDAQMFVVNNQCLSYQQFLFYSKNVDVCYLKESYLYSENDSEISVETLITSLPNLQNVYYAFHPSSKNVSKDTVKKLLQIPHFANLKSFYLCQLSQDFDIDTFYDYYKKNKHMNCVIEYNEEMPSPEYADKLDGIIDEILDDKFRTAKPLGINYPGEDEDKQHAIYKMRESW